MSTLIGTSPLGLAMIKHKNTIARKGLCTEAKNINEELRSTVAKQEAMIALQQKEFHATTAQQAKEIKALTADSERAGIANPEGERLERFEPIKKDLVVSKIISRAACLTELTSNSKSFSNCPDLHGGVPGLPRDRIWMKPALHKEKVVPPTIAVLVA